MENSEHINLHTHSDFSLLDGMIRPSALAKQVAKFGQSAIAVTDHGSVDGWYQHKKACKKENVRPIFGCEIYTIPYVPGFPPSEFSYKKRDQGKYIKRNHLTILVRTSEGFRNLNRLLTRAHLEFYYGRPCIPFDLLCENSEGLTVLSGCPSSPFHSDELDGKKLIRQAYDAFSPHFFAEIIPHDDLELSRQTCVRTIEMGKELNLQFVCTNDIHYLEADDCSTHEVLLAMARHAKWSDPNRWKFDTKQTFLRSPSEMMESLHRMGLESRFAEEAIRNTLLVADSIKFDLPEIPLSLPSPLPPNVDENLFFEKSCRENLQRMGLDSQDNYISRLNYEIKTIIDQGFVRYFLILQDILGWCKSEGILIGNGRGSVSGSLVAFVLGITKIDPIPYGLIFERFINVSRVDYPDIDIDIQDDQIEAVHAYIKNKYGENKVALVSTYLSIGGKQAIRDVARVFDASYADTDSFSKTIQPRGQGQEFEIPSIIETVINSDVGKSYAEKYPEVVYHASQLEGTLKSSGVHAAGIIVTDKDLREGDHCHLVWRKDGIAVNVDKYAIDQFGLMKLDMLKLKNLSAVAETLRLVKERHGVDIDLDSIPLNDKKTYEQIAEGNTATSFQLGSKGMQKYCSELKIEKFAEIVAAVALYRPGPQGAGYHKKFINRKHGQEEIPSFGPIYDDITRETYGLIVYQEQVMFLLNRLAHMSWGKADQIRKIMGKKIGPSEFMTFCDEFVEGCREHSTMEPALAKKLFEDLSNFSLYAFNKAHCLHPNTTIYISKNMREIQTWKLQDLYEHIRLLSLDSSAKLPYIMMFNGRYPAWSKIKDVLKTSIKKIRRITLHNHTLRCSPEHRIAAFDKNNKLRWIQSRYLKVGDKLYCLAIENDQPVKVGWNNYMAAYDYIENIEEEEEIQCFDVEVTPPQHCKFKKKWGHSLFANGVLVHNSVGYGSLAYLTMWLKTHYPIEWLCAMLNKGAQGKTAMTGDITKVDEMLLEVRRMGIQVKTPDLNRSRTIWTIEDDNTLRAGLRMLRGVGDKAIGELSLAQQKEGSFRSLEHLSSSVNRRIIHVGVLDSMVQSGAADTLLGEDSLFWRLNFRNLWQMKKDTREETLDSLRCNRDYIEKYEENERVAVQQEKILYRIDADPVKKYSTIRNRIEEEGRLITTENIAQLPYSDFRIMMGYFTSVRFGHSDNDSVYAYFEDGVKFCRVNISKSIVSRKRKLLESITKKPIMIRVESSGKTKSSIMVTGLWSLDDIQNETDPFPLILLQSSKTSTLPDFNIAKSCNKCELRTMGACTSPVATKPGKLPLFLIGEAPGAEEDRCGEGFVGRTGGLLNNKLNRLGITRDLLYIGNVAKCHPPNNKLPSLKYVDICSKEWLDKEIRQVQPILCLSLGNTARYFFIGNDKGITAVNNTIEWNQRYGCWVIYGVHPSFAARDLGGNGEKMFDATLKTFISTIVLLAGE